MALYGYVKSPVRVEPVKTVQVRPWAPFFSAGLLLGGAVLVFSAFFPIISYQLETASFRRKIVAPVADYELFRQNQLSGVVLGQGGVADYTKASSWYAVDEAVPTRPSRVTHYLLSIPKLGIESATVQVGGEDLMESLVQYPGTALPGQYGNAVIFGHSVLPQFFNPKNYKTIFSTLPQLERGDEVLVDFDGVRYRYVITQMVEASPDDVSVLEQQYNAEYLSLITCVPPGTYLRRLVVRGRLVKV